MKRTLLLVLALMLVAAPSFAQIPDTAYVGLYTDVDHTTWSATYSGVTTTVYMYIFWVPGPDGLQAAEWAISYPSNILQGTITKDADIASTLGTMQAGIAVSMYTCHAGGVWYWTHKVRLFLQDAEQSTIEIVANPTVIPPVYDYSACTLGYPRKPVKRATNLCMNWSCETATQSATWGAIKSLF
ncbi:MAG: hypothetical protein PHD74_10000 [Candidatus Krumholzibacteria bacterium]|nr:hypothetical protein [Candidatus Krumholzibacteria bacterium]